MGERDRVITDVIQDEMSVNGINVPPIDIALAAACATNCARSDSRCFSAKSTKSQTHRPLRRPRTLGMHPRSPLRMIVG